MATSAVLFGSGVMIMSALLSVWGSAVFRERPSTDFSATLLLFGSIAGPAAVGVAADQYGPGKIFFLLAALAISTTLVRPAFDSGRAAPASTDP